MRLLKHYEPYNFYLPLGSLNREVRGARRRSGAARVGRTARARQRRSADRPAEVEYKCGMFMVLPFYFIPGPAKH